MNLGAYTTKLRAILTLALSVLSVYPALAEERILSPREVAAFKSRPSVIVYAPVFLEFENPKSILIEGTVGSDESCKSRQVLHVDPGELNTSEVLTTVDIAFDPEHCEKLVRRGFRPMDDWTRKRINRNSEYGGKIESELAGHAPASAKNLT